MLNVENSISKPLSGVFINLYDEETLKLYLDRGIYGFLMKPIILGEMSPYSKHYAALSDYGCLRDGTHVFFFLKRQIVYGGQIDGSEGVGSFYINGPYSPLGNQIDSGVFWDESVRDVYEETSDLGIFSVSTNDGPVERCQPYLIQFSDKLGLQGKTIISDQLYFEIGRIGYPLPSNAIENMSFCILTPYETEVALRLISNEFVREKSVESIETISLSEEPIPFSVTDGFIDIKNAFQNQLFKNEAHFEFTLLANPTLLPIDVDIDRETICRQIPISPFKPSQMDRADICIYSSDFSTSIPHTIFELKKSKANNRAIEQIVRYLRWLHIIFPARAEEIKAYLLAPSTTNNIRVDEYRNQIEIITYL